MKDLSTLFYSILCGLGLWMTLCQLFAVICLVTSFTQTDFVGSVIVFAVYMLLLTLANPISVRLYKAKPALDPGIFLVAFITGMTSAVCENKASALIAAADRLGISDTGVICSIMIFSVICLFIIFLTLRRIITPLH